MKTSERINGFDALRTIAMWLGIVLHGLIVYKAKPEVNWPHDPDVHVYFLNWLYDYIHIFRMPLFFMVAGFFARFVIKRSGTGYFIKQRFKRIVIPFTIGVILIVPISLLPFNYYQFYYVQEQATNEAWHNSFLQMFKWSGLVHLWFLYYLILFYFFSLTTVFFVGKLKFNFSGKLSRLVENVSLLKLLFISLLLFLILLWLHDVVPPVNTGIRPNPGSLVYYYFFYCWGWIMQTNLKSINSLKKNCWVLFITGTAISVLRFKGVMGNQSEVTYLLAAVQTVSFIAGFTGLFMKFFHAESKVWRYCSDATYWVYIIHLSIIVSLQVAFINSPIPGWLRLPAVLIITFFVTLVSYHFFVRYTIIGEYLHGKRIRPSSKQKIKESTQPTVPG